MDKIYRWRLKGLMKGCDPIESLEFIEKIIEKNGGLITPHILLEESRKPKTPLYNYFEWDDKVAAEHYRLKQARFVLNNIEVVKVKEPVGITDGKEVNLTSQSRPLFEIIMNDQGRGYKSFEKFNITEIEFVKQTTRNSLKILYDKLSFYEELSHIAISLLETIAQIDKESN